MLGPWKFSRFGEISLECVFKSPSDTLNPHGFQFWGMPDRHPRSASGRGGCFFFSSPDGLLSLIRLSAAFADGDGQPLVTVGAQGPVLRVVDKDDPVGAQLIDQDSCIGRTRHPGQGAIPAL
jgi:hypothetical protein